MKKYVITSLLCVLAWTMIGCGNSASNHQTTKTDNSKQGERFPDLGFYNRHLKGYYQLYNSEGEVVIPYEAGYNSIRPFKCACGLFFLVRNKSNNGYGILDASLEEIVPCQYELIMWWWLDEHQRDVYSDARCVILTPKYGGQKCAFRLDRREIVNTFDWYDNLRCADITQPEAKILKERYIITANNGEYSYSNKLYGCYDLYACREVLPKKFTAISVTHNCLYVKIDEDEGCYDLNGNVLVPVGNNSICYESSFDGWEVDKYNEHYDLIRSYTVKIPTYHPRSSSSSSYSGNSCGGYGSYSDAPYPSNGSSTYSTGTNSGSGMSESFYRQSYHEWEEMVANNIQSLQLMQGGGYGAISTMKSNIRDEQNEMRKIREEAAREGYYIPQSSWENASF